MDGKTRTLRRYWDIIMQKIRTAIVGLGKIAHGYDDILSVKKRVQYPTHLSALKKDKRFNLVAVADVGAKQRKIFQKKAAKDVAMYSDYKTMINKENVDLLVVAVPTALHYKVCSVAMGLGVKYILCEKPITSTVAEAKKLIALSKKYHAKILVNYNRSYNKSYEKLTTLIKKKKWGSPQSISVQYTNGILNTATHAINLIEKMFGPITKVSSINKKSNSKDSSISFLALVKGVKIFFEGVENVNYRLFEIDINFKKGRIIINNDVLTEFKAESKNEFSFLKLTKPSLKIDISKMMLEVYENIYQVISYNKKPKCDIKSALETLTVAEYAK